MIQLLVAALLAGVSPAGAPLAGTPLAGTPLAAAPAAGVEPRLLAVGDVLRLGIVADPHLSPDGAWVAYTVETADVKQDKPSRSVYMVPLAGGAALRLTAPGEKPAAAPRFSPDGRWLAFLSAREGRHAQVWLLDRRGGEAQRLTDYPADVADLAWSPDGRRLALVVGDPDPDEVGAAAAGTAGAAGSGGAAGAGGAAPGEEAPPKPIVIHRLQFKRDGEGYLRELRNHLYIFDVQTRTGAQVTSGPYDDSEPAWSPDGKWLAFTSNRTTEPDANENSDIFVVPAAPGFAPRAITTSPGTDQSPAFSPDGKWITYVEGSDPKDFWYGTSRVAVASALPGAGAPRTLTAALDRNVASPRFASDGRSIDFLIEEGGNSHLARVPLAGGTPERVVDGERVVTAFDLDSRGDVVVLESVPERPPEVSVVTAHGLRRLTTTNDEVLRGLRLAQVRRFTARSADGTPVDAYLTLPPDAPAGARLPAILRIHGGPTSQFDTSFHFEWQLLAAHGYAVIGANPRGSAGYGRDFARAIWADWGNRDFQDVMAAVDQVVAMGVADPDRLGVGGWSYGGILTNYVLIRTGRFKAATSGASETNYLADYGTDEYQYAWETELGLPWRNTDLWIKMSPWFQVEKITTPTLLLCGTDDANVPALGVEQLFQALRRLGRETELVLYPGQTHTLTRPSFIVDRYQRYLDWYDKYLQPASSSSRPAGAGR